MVLDIWRPGRSAAAWRPLQQLEEMEKHFEEVFGRNWPALWAHAPTEKAWLPSIDVLEKDGKFVVKAELPGMKLEDINISVDGDMLNIKGEKKTEKEVKEENYYQSECTYGSFSRSIQIPASVDASKITAEYEDGVLEIAIPKAAGVEPKRIPVSAKKKSAK
jgi:HSP20 family protein